ncbi:MAG: SCO family protein [Mariprofundaceae bacterium]
MEKRRLFSKKSLVLFLAITMATAIFFGWRLSTTTVVKIPTEIEDYLFWEAKDLTSFDLMAPDNKTFNLENLKGKWSFIFFGYTHCPDVCPATLSVMGAAFGALAHNPVVASEIQGIFISVDPKRDTPELLKKYVSYFDDEFLGLTGSKNQLDAFTRQIGALYFIDSKNVKDASYDVTHNSTIFLIDPQGRLYGRFSPPQDPLVIANIFVKIRAFYNDQAEKQWLFF